MGGDAGVCACLEWGGNEYNLSPDDVRDSTPTKNPLKRGVFNRGRKKKARRLHSAINPEALGELYTFSAKKKTGRKRTRRERALLGEGSFLSPATTRWKM